MDNFQDKSIFEVDIDEEGKSQFSTIAQWANINAIIGFVSLGLSVISTIIGVGKGVSSAGGDMFGLIITVAISLALNITLLAAATNIKKGIEQTDQGHFALGLNKMATYFKIVGILTIVVLVIFTLALLVVLVAGVGGGFR
ncbi:DUF5362 family protein [Ferruginibacter sp.]|nr:hypothetical protein [Ferruginibacter sp.]